MEMNQFLNDVTQEQAAGILVTNGEKIQVGYHYEIDHKHLPRFIPWDLNFIRIGWVTTVTDVDVKIWYPTLSSLGRSYSGFGDSLTGYVGYDRYYNINNDLVSKVLVRKVTPQEFEAKRRLKSFWRVNLKRRFDSHTTTLKNEQGPQVELEIEEQKLMQGDSGPEKRVKLESQTRAGIRMVHREIRPTWGDSGQGKRLKSESQTPVGIRMVHREISPKWMAQQRIKRGRVWASTVPSTPGASHSTRAWASTVPSTPGASHSTRRIHSKFASKVVSLQKFEEISQDYEDHNDKNSPTFVVALSDSEDDIVELSDIQRPQPTSLLSETSKKLKNLSLTNEGHLERKKKPETLQQTIDSDDANKSDSLNDEKMQQIINELLKVGLNELDVGKAAEICYKDPTKAKVLFGLPSHLRRSYVLGFLYPPN